jgi:hypothetical protein
MLGLKPSGDKDWSELISKLADLDQLRSKLFDELDSDGNGVLDQKEFEPNAPRRKIRRPVIIRVSVKNIILGLYA